MDNTKKQKSRLIDRWYDVDRLGGLRRFAFAITLFNILGHTCLGFEQSWAQPLVALLTAYLLEVCIELCDCGLRKRRPRFLSGMQAFVDFFLPAQITGLACALLLYANDRLMVIAFATAVAIGSKYIFRLSIDGRARHVLNPSNFGITITLLLFPWVGISPPYHFTENLHGVANWVLPGLILLSGTYLNSRFTRRLPVVVSWLSVFILQAIARHWIFGSSLSGALLPMTGVAFILFTFYMVTDPPTSPSSTRGQIAFGASVAAIYGLLMAGHIVFGLFFALTIVTGVRGLYLFGVTLTAQVPASIIPPSPTPTLDATTVGAITGMAAAERGRT